MGDEGREGMRWWEEGEDVDHRCSPYAPLLNQALPRWSHSRESNVTPYCTSCHCKRTAGLVSPSCRICNG